MTTYYQTLVREIDPTLTEEEARGVEASMRLGHNTLNHLPREVFAREIVLYRECERRQPGYGAGLALSYGL